MSLTREQILASRGDRKPVRLEVPEWGGSVYIRHLTVADQVMMSEATKPADMPVAVLIACLVDENEQPIFEQADAAELAKESFAVVLRVFSEAARLNGLTTKELDEAMASFGPARAESPSTDSHSLSGDPSQNSETLTVPS